MIVLSKYKLLKAFPGSPSVGSEVLEMKTVNGRTTHYILTSSIDSHIVKYRVEDIENFPEYWDPIPRKI